MQYQVIFFRVSNPKVWYVRCQKYLLLSKDIHDLLQRRFEPLRNCHRIKDPCKALTTFFKAFLHTFFHALLQDLPHGHPGDSLADMKVAENVDYSPLGRRC